MKQTYIVNVFKPEINNYRFKCSKKALDKAGLRLEDMGALGSGILQTATIELHKRNEKYAMEAMCVWVGNCMQRLYKKFKK